MGRRPPRARRATNAKARLSRHVLQGGIVLAGTDFEVLDPGYLVIEGGRITEVGSGRPGDRSGVVLDARHTIAAPAFRTKRRETSVRACCSALRAMVSLPCRRRTLPRA